MFYRSNLRKSVLIKWIKHTRKSQVQNLCSKCSPLIWTQVLKQVCHYAIAAAMRSGPAASTPSAKWEDVLSTPSHHGSANGRPSLQGYPRRCSAPDSNPVNWMVTSLGDVSLCSSVPVSRSQCDFHIWRQCVISLISTLRH